MAPPKVTGNKFGRKHLAIGAWSNPHKVIEMLEIPAKVRVSLQDKLIARGLWVSLYLPVSSDDAGVVACTCVKETSTIGDRQCLSCYGTKYAPGYQKFLCDTHFWCSAEVSDMTLTNVSTLTTKKAHVLALSSGATTGTIVTQDKAFSQPATGSWELKLDAFGRSAGATVGLEFSINAGGSWTAVTLTADTRGYTGSISLPAAGNIRFRITLSRTSTSVLSPAFEIVRIRRVRTEDENQRTIIQRSDHVAGTILILRPWIQEQDSIESGRGRVIDHMADRTWTAPLDFFDTSITPDTPAVKINDHLGGHPFYKYVKGAQTDIEYVLTKTYWSDKMGTFTHQYFDDRKAQEGEPYHSVW